MSNAGSKQPCMASAKSPKLSIGTFLSGSRMIFGITTGIIVVVWNQASAYILECMATSLINDHAKYYIQSTIILYHIAQEGKNIWEKNKITLVL